MRSVHFIGIGGSGLSAIACVLLESGVQVSGSDRQESVLAERLRQAGAQVFIGHRAENIGLVEVVVRSSAVQDDNPEVQAALQVGIPVLKRAEFLGEWMQANPQQLGIAIAGTHGKTTTTAMIAWMLAALEQDPTYIIGGVSTNLGANAHAGQGQYFVIEADEYDRMFHGLKPYLAVVTNIEHDHPDCYPTPEDFYAAFAHFAAGIVAGGALIACADDPGAARLLGQAAGQGTQTLAYGIGARAGVDYAAEAVEPNEKGGFTYQLKISTAASNVRQAVSLQAPGLHNVRNSLAALAVAHRLGLPLPQAAQALGEFSGTGRRFEVKGEGGGVTVIDDYAHHPTEIQATLAAARSKYPGRRIWAVWQPHTYSRTRTLLASFTHAFGEADQVVVTDVFAARESAPADGFSGKTVARALAQVIAPERVYFAARLEDAAARLVERLQPGDVLLVLSAGDADRISRQVLDRLKE